METRKKVLLIYGIVIFIILLGILFFIPDEFFLKFFQSNIEKIEEKAKESEEPKEFVDYDIQIERLLKKKFDYEYVLLDTIDEKGYTFKCTGSMDGTKEEGSCTRPDSFSYTEKDKQEKFKTNPNYTSVDYWFNLLKDVTPKETKNQTYREYNYKVKIDNLDTEVVVFTSLENILKMEISNQKMTYIIKFKNISY